MLPSEIKFTNKIKTIINDRSKVLYLQGTMNSSKSFPSGIAFLFRIMEMPEDANIFVLAGKSKSWLERYVSDSASFVNIFPNVCTYKAGSNAHIEVKTRTGIKRVYLCGFDNKSTWGNVLGLNIRGFLIEEINTAHPEFVKQCFGRISRFPDAFIICNSNGGEPDDELFTDFLFRCTPHPDYVDDIPSNTLELFNSCENKREDWIYIFSTFYENPVVTEKTIKEMVNTYPVGSYQHLIYILGEMGSPTGLVFREYMSPRMFITEEEFNKFRITDMYVGIDHGVSDLTVFTLSAISNKNEVIVIDTYETNMKSDDELYVSFSKWFNPLYEKYMGKLRALYVDSAAQHLKLYFNKKSRLDYNLPAEDAWKFGDHDLQNRVDLNLQLIHQNKLFFFNKAEQIYKAIGKIKYSEKANELIDRITDHDSVDRWDSFNYSISRHHIPLSRQ